MYKHPFKSEEDQDSEKSLEVLQEKVKHFWPRLKVNPRLAEPFKMDEELFEIYLSKFKEKKHAEVMRRFINTFLHNISMDELLANLRKCVIKLNTKEPKDFMLLVQEHHSQQWMAELALRHLNELPLGCINMESMHFNWEYRSLKEASTIVMFDDCSYTGTQICDFILPKLFREVEKNKSDSPVKVYFVIPFITKPAFEKVMQEFEKLKKDNIEWVDITLEIIHEEFIPTIGDLLVPEEDKPLLVEALQPACYEKLERYVMITTDWKGAPDYVSFIPSIRNATVDYKVSKYTGYRHEDVPEHIRKAGPFLPEVKTPYCLEMSWETDPSLIHL